MGVHWMDQLLQHDSFTKERVYVPESSKKWGQRRFWKEAKTPPEFGSDGEREREREQAIPLRFLSPSFLPFWGVFGPGCQSFPFQVAVPWFYVPPCSLFHTSDTPLRLVIVRPRHWLTVILKFGEQTWMKRSRKGKNPPKSRPRPISQFGVPNEGKSGEWVAICFFFCLSSSRSSIFFPWRMDEPWQMTITFGLVLARNPRSRVAQAAAEIKAKQWGNFPWLIAEPKFSIVFSSFTRLARR